MDKDIHKVNEVILAAPLHAGARLRIVEQADGLARVRFDVTPLISGPTGMLHGGVLYALLDTACYLALLPALDGHDAVSHDAHFSIVRPVDAGSTVEIRSSVERKGRNLAFLRAQAFRVVEGQEFPLVALGTVTKTVLAKRPGQIKP